MKNIFKSMLFLLAASTSVVLTSCSDDDLPAADALFRPVITENDNIKHGLDANLSPYMIVTWDNYTDATEYVITAEANDGSDTKTITTEETTCTFTNLEYDKEYNVSIRCVNANTGLQSKDYTLTTTTLDYPTKLLTPGATDIIDVAARISWSGIEYDRLDIVDDTEEALVVSVELTEENNANGNVVVEGLEPKTTYQARAYANGQYLGKKRFTTVAEESFGDDAVLDLRDLTPEESYKFITTAKISADIEANPGKDITYVLKGGVKYYAKIDIPACENRIKFVTGLTLEGNAIFDNDGAMKQVTGAEIKSIVFEKIDFTPGTDDLTSYSGNSYSGKQVFNPEAAGNIENLIFKSCKIGAGYRAVVRSKVAECGINNIEFDDCIIHGVGDQGVVTSDNKAGDFRTVTVKNSTLTNIVRFCDLRTTKGDEVAITIENCTFCYVSVSDDGTALIRNESKKTTLKISNSLFGPSMAAEYNVDYKAGDGASPLINLKDASIDISNCYKTTFDIKISNGELALEDLKMKEADLWKSPTKGDFTIIGKLPETGIGDPRWYE